MVNNKARVKNYLNMEKTILGQLLNYKVFPYDTKLAYIQMALHNSSTIFETTFKYLQKWEIKLLGFFFFSIKIVNRWRVISGTVTYFNDWQHTFYWGYKVRWEIKLSYVHLLNHMLNRWKCKQRGCSFFSVGKPDHEGFDTGTQLKKVRKPIWKIF